MAKQTINIGASPNDGTGTPLRTAFDYTNQNFTELYTATGPSGNNIVVPGSATITGALTVGDGTNATLNFIGVTNILNLGFGSLRGGSAYGDVRLWTDRFRIYNNAGTQIIKNISGTNGDETWYDGAGGTRMTLNATGLGVGDSPSYKLHVARTADGTVGYFRRIGATINPALTVYCNETGNTVGFGTDYAGAASPAITFTTAGTERLRIDASGNCGIGVTPSAWAANRKALQIGGLAAAALALNGTSNVSEMFFNSFINTSASNVYAVNGRAGLIDFGSGGFGFSIDSGTQTAGAACNFTRAMTLDAAGGLSVGATGGSAYTSKLYLKYTTAVWNVGPLSVTDNFYIASSTTTGVYLTTSGTAWTSNSDERLKDIIEPISNAVAKVGSLRSVIGKFKNDDTNTRRSFLIAQDVQAVLPEAVDASNPDKLGVAYSDVIPLLVAAIKELTAEVNALKNA